MKVAYRHVHSDQARSFSPAVRRVALMSGPYTAEPFAPEERALLSRHVTDVEGPVFALVGLPEVTCAALFARYSRSPKSLRRLLLDEFLSGKDVGAPSEPAAGRARAADLFG